MQIPSEQVAAGRLIKAGNHTRGRLNANKETRAQLLPAFDIAQSALKKANDAVREADDAVEFIKGPVEEVDDAANDVLTEFQLDALKAVNKNLKHALYLSLLPDGLTGARKLTGRAMQKFVADVLDVLKDLPKDHPLNAYAPKMTALHKSYEQPCKDVEAAQLSLNKAEKVRSAARTAWVVAWEVLYGALRSKFPGRQGYVEGFFTRFTKATKVKKEPTV